MQDASKAIFQTLFISLFQNALCLTMGVITSDALRNDMKIWLHIHRNPSKTWVTSDRLMLMTLALAI